MNLCEWSPKKPEGGSSVVTPACYMNVRPRPQIAHPQVIFVLISLQETPSQFSRMSEIL